MSGFEGLLAGLAVAFTLQNLLFALVGTVVGTLIGVLPGIGPALTIALLLPLTYGLDPRRRSSCSPASTTARCTADRRPRSC